MRARRALLYVPGDDRHKLEKAAGLKADCICLDLEDGVAVNRKQEARQEILTCLNTIDFGISERLVRMNSIPTGLCEEDLLAVIPGKPDGIFLPKVTNSDQIHWLHGKMDVLEKKAGINSGKMVIVAGIESALGLLHLGEICQASSRLSALVFGAEDYVADIGGVRTEAGSEVSYARSILVTHAAAYNLQAIDMVCTDFKNVKRLIDEALTGVQMGFSGKQVIHPLQVEPVQRVFTPNPESIEYAARILEAYRDNLTVGKGAFALDGHMVDLPIVKAAERLLARASFFEEQK